MVMGVQQFLRDSYWTVAVVEADTNKGFFIDNGSAQLKP